MNPNATLFHIFFMDSNETLLNDSTSVIFSKFKRKKMCHIGIPYCDINA